jgi:hypothetical protein
MQCGYRTLEVWYAELKDGTRVVVVTVGAKIESVVHDAADGKSFDLLK